MKGIVFRIGLVLCGLLSIIGCAPAKIPEAMVTAAITATREPVATALPSATIAPSPSSSPLPTITRTTVPTATRSPTDEPYLTPTIPQATLNALETLDAFVGRHPEVGKYYSWNCMLYPCYTSGLGLSPNGQWAAFFSFTPEGNGGLKIARLDGTRTWEIYFAEITGWICPCGDALVTIEHWSRDGQYLYVAPDQRGDGGYDYFWRTYVKLIRLDLETGRWVDTKMGSSYAFAPNDKYIAYRTDQGIRVYLFRTGSDQIFSLPDRYLDYGVFTWSPDSKRFILAAASGDLETEENGFSIFLIDLEAESMTLIVEDDLRFLYPVEWHETDVVLLKGLFDHDYYKLNLVNNEISQVNLPSP